MWYYVCHYYYSSFVCIVHSHSLIGTLMESSEAEEERLRERGPRRAKEKEARRRRERETERGKEKEEEKSSTIPRTRCHRVESSTKKG